MNRKEKLSVLSILIIIMIILITRQSLLLHREIRNIKPPTMENRQFGNMSIYKWMTVKRLAKKHNIKEENIFKALEIKPEKGDEDMPIWKLSKKYNKNPQQIEENLMKIISRHKPTEGRIYE
ncbi:MULTISPECIES: hypothetical protein [Clostridium]|uniref:hypothetical protein n=1 Tax=Clostridium TaxID=1485 RepID=UPI00069E0D3E|nr:MULTISPECIES: hypothetical protein [Clostridium]KOF55757.1 hypothetical protein AGR56_18235 [Clostridium sp. DMHC 10]MCD2347073.1 hypothetical protein [Clostridium guangxiense]